MPLEPTHDGVEQCTIDTCICMHAYTGCLPDL